MVLVRQASVHYDESAIYPQLLIDFSHNNIKLGFTCSIWDIVGLEHSIVNAFFHPTIVPKSTTRKQLTH